MVMIIVVISVRVVLYVPQGYSLTRVDDLEIGERRGQPLQQLRFKWDPDSEERFRPSQVSHGPGTGIECRR